MNLSGLIWFLYAFKCQINLIINKKNCIYDKNYLINQVIRIKRIVNFI